MRNLLFTIIGLFTFGFANAQNPNEQEGVIGDFETRYSFGSEDGTGNVYYFGTVNGESVVRGANRGEYKGRLRFGNFNGRGSSYIFFVTKEGQTPGNVQVDFIFNGDKGSITNVQSTIDADGDVSLNVFGDGFFAKLSGASFVHVRVVVDGYTSVFKFNVKGAQSLIEMIVKTSKFYTEREENNKNPFGAGTDSDDPFQG